MRLISFFLVILILAVVTVGKNKRPISIDDLWSMNRISSFSVSADGSKILFSATTYSMGKNNSTTKFWLMNSDGSDLKEFKTEKKISEAKFLPDGNILFVSDKSVYTVNQDGKNEKELFSLYTGVSGLKYNKDASKYIFISSVYPECQTQECNKNKDEQEEKSVVKAQVFTELLYKHWNDWRGKKRSHLFLYDVKTKVVTDLTPGATWDVPPLALGGYNDYSFSADGKSVTFAANTTEFPADNTNNDIFEIKLADVKKGYEPKKTVLFKNEANDTDPVYSPDNKYIAFCSMERAGFEADKRRLMIKDVATGKTIDISANYDKSTGQFIWSPDSKYIYFTSANTIYTTIYRIDVKTAKLETILEKADASSLALCAKGKKLYFKDQKSTMPNELFVLDTKSKEKTQLTFVNKDILANLEMNEVETFWSEGAEGAKVQSILVKPPHFDPKKKYPLIFLIHGGPQGHWTDDFHYRWNLQMFAAPGYVVVAPNPRGSTGYGQKFTDEISRDWGGKVYVDLMNAYDHAIEKYEFIDKNNTFAAGASYGGYMINWIEGHTDRFTALICHAGVFNLESMYGVTEELWFPEWEMGGTPWENRELYKKWSPHNYVQNFKTPMLVIHGAYDFRVPEGQAFELFTSLQKMGVESKLLYFPDEYHFVVKPQNAKLWWNSVYKWIDDYTEVK